MFLCYIFKLASARVGHRLQQQAQSSSPLVSLLRLYEIQILVFAQQYECLVNRAQPAFWQPVEVQSTPNRTAKPPAS